MQHRRRLRPSIAALVAALFAFACSDDPAGPERGYTIRIHAGNDQFAGFGQQLENPLQVVVENAATGEPAQNITVSWSVVTGNGASLGNDATITDANGVASTTLTLGPTDAAYEVRATVPDRVGSAATFAATAVNPATIASIAPAAVTVGDTVTIQGSGFAASAANNTVLIDGFRALVVEASAGTLRAVVPACVPTGSVAVQVNLGIVASNTVQLDVTGSSQVALALNVGEVRHFSNAGSLECIRLAPIAGAQYVLLLQNATPVSGQVMEWRFTARTSGLLTAPARGDARFGSLAPFRSPAARRAHPQELLDLELRELEAAAGAQARGAAPRMAQSVAAAEDVEVGDERQFWVFRRVGEYERVTAVVRHISEHAILYEDLDSPEGGFQAGDFEAFGAVFDDPIYETLVDVYGEPSDVDDNGRVIILFTPVVNLLTPPGSGNSFVAGFFFGIDLLDGHSRGNDAEVFYTLVPDPEGVLGNVRTFEHMLRGVPPVMAHEFQHMIHFNQRVLVRDASLEQTWLSEGLAHTAEELVGDAYLERGEDERAFDFRVQNFLRADAWLNDPAAVSVVGPAVPLAVRGASWLLLEYLQGHFGGDDFLSQVTLSTESGVANLSARTGLDWGTILARWGIAIWADDAGIPGVDPVYSFPTVDLRAVYESSGFPLLPLPLPWADAQRSGVLPSAGSRYWFLDAGLTPTQLNVAVAGRHAPFGAADRPQLSIIRIQ